jgi:hypothetical protein
MYHSGVTVGELIVEMQEEVDIAGVVPASAYYRWISSLEALLYSDVLLFDRQASLAAVDGFLDLSLLTVGEGERTVLFDDVRKVYLDGEELTRSGRVGAYQFDEEKSIYYPDENGIRVSVYGEGGDETYDIIWRVIPAPKTGDGDEVMLPVEWLDMVMARLRGEAYKVANDDEQAAKWLGDYNTQLTSFREWAAIRVRRYGE